MIQKILDYLRGRQYELLRQSSNRRNLTYNGIKVIE